MSRVAHIALKQLGWGPVHLIAADGFFLRLLGMMAVPLVAPDGLPYALAFPHCRAVHTCFMRHHLDVAFVDAAGDVLTLHEGVPPWRFLSHPGAMLVLERISIKKKGCRSASLKASDGG